MKTRRIVVDVEAIAFHPRLFERHNAVLDPLPYIGAREHEHRALEPSALSSVDSDPLRKRRPGAGAPPDVWRLMRLTQFVRPIVALALTIGICLGVRAHARADAVSSMQGMDAHMEMTVRSSPRPGDRTRADAIVAAARRVMARYPTVAAAEAAGFTKFLPGVALPVEHYSNDDYGLEAESGHFDPMHPTSLIFKRDESRLTLVGVMYTAAQDADAAELNRRVPLSVATWHRHVAACDGPPGTPRAAYFGPHARFGLLGSIVTKDACDAAGGTFEPIVFGWMVHLWPAQSDPAKIWAVDPDHSMSRSGMTDHAGNR